MPSKRPSHDGLHFFTILAFRRRRPGTREHLRLGGAYVNCWIDFRLYEGALALAKFYIRQEGWRIRAVEAHRWIDGPNEVARRSVKYFREAKRDGASFVFHRYPTRRRLGKARG
jgi:hypothetical protein